MLIIFPLSVFLEGIAGLSSHDTDIWILAIALGWLGIFTHFNLLKLWWIMRGRPTLSLGFLLLLSGIGGAIQGAAVGFTVESFGLSSEVSIFHRIFLGFISTLMWLPVNAFLVSSILSFRGQRANLLKRAETLNAIAFRQNGLATKVRKVVEEAVITELKWSRFTAQEKFKSTIEDGVESGMQSKLLKSYASEELRSISHNLWERSRNGVASNPKIESFSRASIRELFKLGLHLPPYDIKVYSVIYASAVLPILSKNSHSKLEIFNAAFILICFYILMFIGERIYKRFPQFSPQIFTLRTVIAVYLPFYLFHLINPKANFWTYPHPLSFQISNILLAFFVVLILTLSKAAVYSQEQILIALQRMTNSQKAQVNYATIEIATVSRQWAQYIHGTLQSRLLAAAAVLEKSIETTDLGLRDLAISQSMQIMDEDFEIPIPGERNLLEEALFRIGNWRDLIEVEIDCSIETDLPWIPVESFGLAVEEAIANAFRHGHATRILISMHLINGSDLECTFIDDGQGLAQNLEEGLGSQIFTQASRGNWSREPGPDGRGTRVHMIISGLSI
ncbi:MAG: hypothetical protein F2830_04460 [Actinobacteria bacterium]|nr:hypothetical protein [Actinomycetota bacterium]